MEDRKGKVCCFTGHRRIGDSYVVRLNEAVKDELEALIADGYTVFKAGGALGFDMMAALNVILKRKKYGFIRLDLYLPCRDQDRYWRDFDKTTYEFIIKNADSVTYVNERYTPYCMFARNRALVDGSDLCVAFCFPKQRSGGTYYTMNYASKKGVECRNLYYKLVRQ